jgi:peptidyl-prolyl cis-trans isomerase C
MQTWKAVVGLLVVALAAGCTKKETAARAPQPSARAPAAVASAPAALMVPDVAPATVLVDVDGTKLTVGEADQRIEQSMAARGMDIPAEQRARLLGAYRQQVAEQFVVQTLLQNEATRQNVQVGEAELTNALATIRARLPEGVSLEEMMAREGVTEATLRSNLVTELRMKALVEGQFKDLKPTEAQVTEFYEAEKERFAQPESVRARHILVKVDKADDAAAKTAKKQKLEDLKKQLDGGADFAELAKANSECPSARNGGELPPFGKGEMVPPFEEAAFLQATNAIGPIVETEFGYHVIQVLAHNAARTVPLDEVREMITARLEQQKQQQAFGDYLKGLKAKATITYSEQAKPPAAPALPAVPET